MKDLGPSLQLWDVKNDSSHIQPVVTLAWDSLPFSSCSLRAVRASSCRPKTPEAQRTKDLSCTVWAANWKQMEMNWREHCTSIWLFNSDHVFIYMSTKKQRTLLLEQKHPAISQRIRGSSQALRLQIDLKMFFCILFSELKSAPWLLQMKAFEGIPTVKIMAEKRL